MGSRPKGHDESDTKQGTRQNVSVPSLLPERARFRKRTRAALCRDGSPVKRRARAAVRLASCCT